MEPPNLNRTRRACAGFVGALVATMLLLRLAVLTPYKSVHFVSLVLAFAVTLPMTIRFYSRLAQPPGSPPTTRVPKKLAIPIIFLGVVSTLPSGIGLILAMSTRDETLFNTRTMGALSAIFLSGVFVTWYVLRRNVGFVRALRFRFGLRTLLAFMLVIPPAVFVGWRLTVLLPAQRRYEEARAELTVAVLTEMPMDAATERLLADVRDSWTQHSNELDGAYAQSLKTINRSASVSTLVDLLTYRMPPFSLLSPKRNYEPVVIGTIQAVVLPTSVDGHIYVSEDRNRALIRVKPNVVFLFENDAQGMRETDWVSKVVNQQQCNDGSNEEP